MLLRLILVALLAVPVAQPAVAQQSARTQQVCFRLDYAQREALAARGDADAIYCSAIWSAVSYADETMEQARRVSMRAKALALKASAARLGYDFRGVVMGGMTFDQLIADGDELTRNGGKRHAQADDEDDVEMPQGPAFSQHPVGCPNGGYNIHGDDSAPLFVCW